MLLKFFGRKSFIVFAPDDPPAGPPAPDPDKDKDKKPIMPPPDDAPGKDKGGNGEIVFKSEAELQAEIDKRLTARLEREKKKTEAATQKAREEAEAASLVEQKKFQELAEKRLARVTELETAAAEIEPLKQKLADTEAALKDYLKAQRQGLPEHILKLLDKLEPPEQLKYIAANREALGKTPDGVPPSPKPDGKGLTKEQEAAAQEAASQQYQSRF